MSLVELVAVFAVDVNCHSLRKDTGVPQYGLFVLIMQCVGFLYTYSGRLHLAGLDLHCDVPKEISKENSTIICTDVIKSLSMDVLWSGYVQVYVQHYIQ